MKYISACRRALKKQDQIKLAYFPAGYELRHVVLPTALFGKDDPEEEELRRKKKLPPYENTQGGILSHSVCQVAISNVSPTSFV